MYDKKFDIYKPWYVQQKTVLTFFSLIVDKLVIITTIIKIIKKMMYVSK